MKNLIILLLLCFIQAELHSQIVYKQTIRGIVTDKNTEQPLPGASVALTTTSLQTGTITNNKGEFRLENVAIGRNNLIISYIGYETVTLTNLLISSGKELVLDIKMEEKVLSAREVVIKANNRKDLPLNELATVSARTFNSEQSERYAGSVGDPARMVSNFAGVMSMFDQRNDIVIRGNSPTNVLWRMDGVDIPNPNHFGVIGTTGGPVSMLNNNLLTNSDFFSGAFPAQYGNALSGVFDLRMRSGNNEKRENVAQLTFTGLEIGSEGPINQKTKSSYLINYRYSTFALMDKLFGVEKMSLTAIPKYQDISFKLLFPTKHAGKFTLWGLGGISDIASDESKDDSSKWSTKYMGQSFEMGASMGVLNLSHLYLFKNNSRLETNLTLSGIRNLSKLDTFTTEHPQLSRYYGQNSKEVKYSLSTSFKKKINAKNTSESGITMDLIDYSYMDSNAVDSAHFRTNINICGKLALIKAYSQWQLKITDELIFTTGLHFMYFTYNNTWTLEPRAGLKWKMTENQSISAGIGLHSQLLPYMFYMVENNLPGGVADHINKNLKFSKSIHFVLGYDYLIVPDLRLKVEAYYQHLYDIPVRENEPAYSQINFGADWINSLPVIDSLVNKGTGNNYGVELTLEKFLNHGYYFLITTSLFESKYKGADGIERNTAFNSNYILNVLAGKEFKIKEKNILGIDIKMSWAGGNRYLPYNLQKIGQYSYRMVPDWDNAYKNQYPDFFKVNLRISYKINFKKTNNEFAIDVINLTNHKNIFMQTYDPTTGEKKYLYQFSFMPSIFWRMQF